MSFLRASIKEQEQCSSKDTSTKENSSNNDDARETNNTDLGEIDFVKIQTMI